MFQKRCCSMVHHTSQCYRLRASQWSTTTSRLCEQLGLTKSSALDELDFVTPTLSTRVVARSKLPRVFWPKGESWIGGAGRATSGRRATRKSKRTPFSGPSLILARKRMILGKALIACLFRVEQPVHNGFTPSFLERARSD